MSRNDCYIDDVLEARRKGRFDPEKYCYDKDHGRKKLDPDEQSHKLYEDLARVISGKINHTENEIVLTKTKKTELIDRDGRRYGSDYIGPSWNWARREYDFTDREIGEGLRVTRILGGHMLWLRESPSVNTAKGGRGIYDRMDLCLDEIRHAYESGFRGEARHKEALYKVICSEKEWFELFGYELEGFKSFIDFFFLNDYVTEDYGVISLSLSRCMEDRYELVEEECRRISRHKISLKDNCYLPGRQFGLNLSLEERKGAYRQYVKNCICLIEKRTERMWKKYEDTL